MTFFTRKIKSLIFIFFIVNILSFSLSLFYPIKENCFLLCKSFFVEKKIKIDSSNIEYLNYEKRNDTFVVTGKEHLLFKEDINVFVKDIKINLKEPLEEGQSFKIYVYDKKAEKTLLIYDNNGLDLCYLNINLNKKISNIIIETGNNIGDEICFDSIVFNDNKDLIKSIQNYNFFSQINQLNFWIRYLISFFFLMFVGFHFIFNIEKFYGRIYKYRYYIAFCVILFAIAFELNNTSIEFWRFSNNSPDLIFGKARLIRSDEYCTYTPMLLSQDPNYNYFSDVLRGTKTDMFMVYGQPVKNIVCIFRPFLLAFLFLGSAKGLSFFWIMRLVLLFLVTFEFLLLITRENKKLSFVGSVLVTFAPVVQWWWTPSGIAEIIIYGELLILLLNNYFTQENYIKRILELFLISILLGSYVLVLYPAWQVPFAYIFSFTFLGICFENYKKYKFYKKDVLPILTCLFLLILAAVYIYGKSKETIDIITNTVYPGGRIETGGNNPIAYFFKYWGNIFFPFSDQNLKANPCVLSSFFDLFPIGLIVAFIVLFKDKIKDKFLIILLCLDLFFILWCIIGFPIIVAKVTMMKVSPTVRTVAILGYLNILILLRSLALQKYRFSVFVSGIISIFISFIAVCSNTIVYERYFDIFKIFITSIICFILSYLVLRNKTNKFFIALIILVMFFAGGTVNPIQKGIDVINNSQLYKAIKSINNQDKGLWITEGDIVMFWFRNFSIMAGAASFNSTNTYPNLKAFKMLDKENKYEKVYNRYAHIYINLVKDNNVEKFSLGQEDVIIINLTVEDIEMLDIKYILTRRKLECFDSDRIMFENIFYTCTDNIDFYIYKVKNISKEENIK